ncbi:hypothetical protein PTIM40_68 [Cyanophage P-TIM40]|uniref:Uncharacterized protein n=1 Tax=Cyanophage P-TIM40 TaxID=1589733 RepID=A0A0C5AMV8_9CAUD|nr:hypothetical protein [Nonlabens xiamenensis]YP_009188143.1 hypothetical protein AU107_gp068 [Cyanophage P-TIM40]AJK27495.1 hypothetical protein PTIM40_68 [Cyanophage P-TIM40]|tara:strand:- start:3719 stop:4039 length:321 start_codon:yes stop_codon:yes gene_type:complete
MEDQLAIINSHLDLNVSTYSEHVYVSEDYVENDHGIQLSAFTITEDLSGEHVGDYNAYKYRVNARKQLDNGVFIYTKIGGYDTVCECKEFIEKYINEAITQTILAS